MVRTFLFDYGGVISSGGMLHDNGPPEKLARSLGISVERSAGLVVPLWDEYSAGKITEADMWHDISLRYGQTIKAIHWDIWNHAPEMTPLPEMVTLIGDLKESGYRVGLLSNVIPNTEKELRVAGFYEPFDFTVLSCEVGYKKPDREIYELALQNIVDGSPEEVVFLDDQERFLVPARALGMQAIHVTSPEQAIGDIWALLAQDKHKQVD